MAVPVGINSAIPLSAGTGNPTLNTQDVPKNSAVSSSEKIVHSGVKGVYKNLGAKVKNINGFDILNFSIAPGASVITNQETMTFMDGGLVTEAQLGSGGIWAGIKRGITGSSVLQNMVSNPTDSVRKISLSPLLQGSIVQVNIKPGESWRFSNKSFLACSPNLTVSGSLNIFKNFSLMFVNENLTYITVKADQGSEGIVWISAYGGVVKHDMAMGTADTVPLFINNGCFLGMLEKNGAIDFWSDYVSVGTANGLFSAMFTQLGWVMKIQDSNPPRHPGQVHCTILTQSLNPHNFERYIASVANETRNQPSATYLTSGIVSTQVAQESGWGFFGSRQNQNQGPNQNQGQVNQGQWNQVEAYQSDQEEGQLWGGKTKKQSKNRKSKTLRKPRLI